ncbi:MAG: GDSL-type esterase/lipase family protein [Flavobacteriales bacterium]|nr:hypothetical protein [Flavobacteriales bacterium]
MCLDRRPISALCTFLLGCIVCAQDNPVRPPERVFINLEANTIILKGDSAPWNVWNGKLDSLFTYGRGQLNIVHIGGSHIQADMWTMELRHRFQTVVPGVGGARGFIFPFAMAKTNNPYWYVPKFSGKWSMVKNTTQADSSELGLAGYSVTTTDPHTELSINFRGEAYSGYAFNTVKVLHSMDNSFGVEAVTSDSLISISKRVDEANGFTEFTFSQQVDTLKLQFNRTDTVQNKFTLYGITLENDDPGFVYHAIGVNGASTPSYLRCQRFTQDLALLDPDLVVFSIGINDAHDPNFSAERFKNNYEQLIRNVLSVAPKATILLTTNTDSYVKRRTPNPNANAVRQVMLDLSAEYGCAVWDTYNVMGGSGSIAAWQAAGVARPDRIHFDREGYVLLGDMMFSSIMESYGDHVRRRYGSK